MAIIYSYPSVASLQTTDLFIISRVPADPDEISNFSVTTDTLATFVTSRVNLNFQGGVGTGVVNLDTQSLNVIGTTNEIETTANAQTLQIGLPDDVTIANNLTIGGDFTGDRGAFANDLSVGADLTVSGLTETDTLQVNNTAFIGGVLTIEDNINMTQNGRIINLENPINAQDAATKDYVDTAVTGLLEFKGTFRADTGEILSGSNAGAYLYNCPGGAGTRVAVAVGDYYIVANAGGSFYCSGDLLNIGDSVFAVADAASDSSTINDWGTVEGDNIEGSGTANTIPLWTDSQVLSDSNISQDVQGTVVINANTTISDELTMGNSILMDGNTIAELPTPTSNDEAANKAYVDTTAGAVDLDFTGNSGTGNVQQGSTFDILGSGPITTSASGTTLTINSSAAEGTGTTNTLPIWSDGPNGVLGDSGIRELRNGIGDIDSVFITTSVATSPLNVTFGTGGATSFKQGATEFIKLTDDDNGFYAANFKYEGKLTVDRDTASQNPSLDVGDSDHTYPAAWFRNGVVISNNPSGVQVDNTSMVIGAGNNDNVSGSDHCLIVGSGNQITNNSDQSVAFGQGNTITDSIDATAAGNQNTITSSGRSLALGFSNQITNSTSSFVAGGENTVPNGTTNMVLGYQNTAPSGGDNFIFGNLITGNPGLTPMTLGFRNDPSGYPTNNTNLGLGNPKFVVAVGSNTTTDANALIITEGGVNGGSSGTVPQVPRVILPTVPSFSASNDAAADALGVPEGALYQNQGIVQINRGSGSTTNPLALKSLSDTEIESGRVRLSTLSTGGSGYTVANNVPTTGGSGTGLEINILTLGAGDSIATYSIAPIRDGADYVAGDVVTVNAGNVDATITIDETWPLGGNTLVYNTNDDVWINDATLTVDYINRRVGIGTTNPSVGFHCDPKARFRNEIQIAQKNNNAILGEGSNFNNLTGAANTAVGLNIMAAATTANNNSILGYNAFNAALTGNRNVAIGSGAIGLTTAIGEGNIAIGYQALQNGTGANNIAIGQGAISNSAGGSSNVSIGRNTLVDNTSSNNVAVGERALQNNTSGTFNTAVGAQSLNAVTGGIGRQNVGLGFQAGNNITTGQNNIVIGFQAQASTPTASNEITLGNSSISVLRCAVTTITSLSDERDKTDITNLEYGLDFINSLSPKQFTWNQRPEYAIEIDDDGNETQVEVENANKGKKDFGFIAQDVQSVDNDILRLVYAENPEKLEMSYGKLVPILVQAIKDLTNRIEALEA